MIKSDLMSLELVLDFFKMTNVVEFLSNLQGRKFEPRRLQLADDVVVVDIVVVIFASSDADGLGLNLRSEKMIFLNLRNMVIKRTWRHKAFRVKLY